MALTDHELEAYLDEALPAAEMAVVEAELRTSSRLRDRLSAINGRRDAGVHTLGAIWRRRRLTCPTREEIGAYLLGTLAREHADYVAFHLDTVACRICQANYEDLRRQSEESRAEAESAAVSRRKKYFQSSAGYLDLDKA